MQKLRRAYLPEPTEEQRNGNREFAKKHGFTEEQADNIFETLKADEIWANRIYQANLRYIDSDPPLIHLSIKRRDREPIHDWRALQEIKNQLVGEEYEAVELYPAESRLVDTANQYHLWAVNDKSFRFPLGFTARMVDDDDYGIGSKQRPFDEELL